MPKRRFKARIARNVPEALSYEGDPESRQQKLELSRANVLRMLEKMKNLPIGRQHEEDGYGTVIGSHLDHNSDWWIEMEFDDGDPGALESIRKIENGDLQQVSLMHNFRKLIPVEVSLVFKGARPGTDIEMNSNDDNNSDSYMVDADVEISEHGALSDSENVDYVSAALTDEDVVDMSNSGSQNNGSVPSSSAGGGGGGGGNGVRSGSTKGSSNNNNNGASGRLPSKQQQPHRANDNGSTGSKSNRRSYQQTQNGKSSNSGTKGTSRRGVQVTPPLSNEMREFLDRQKVLNTELEQKINELEGRQYENVRNQNDLPEPKRKRTRNPETSGQADMDTSADGGEDADSEDMGQRKRRARFDGKAESTRPARMRDEGEPEDDRSDEHEQDGDSEMGSNVEFDEEDASNNAQRRARELKTRPLMSARNERLLNAIDKLTTKNVLSIDEKQVMLAYIEQTAQREKALQRRLAKMHETQQKTEAERSSDREKAKIAEQWLSKKREAFGTSFADFMRAKGHSRGEIDEFLTSVHEGEQDKLLYRFGDQMIEAGAYANEHLELQAHDNPQSHADAELKRRSRLVQNLVRESVRPNRFTRALDDGDEEEEEEEYDEDDESMDEALDRPDDNRRDGYGLPGKSDHAKRNGEMHDEFNDEEDGDGQGDYSDEYGNDVEMSQPENLPGSVEYDRKDSRPHSSNQRRPRLRKSQSSSSSTSSSSSSSGGKDLQRPQKRPAVNSNRPGQTQSKRGSNKGERGTRPSNGRQRPKQSPQAAFWATRRPKQKFPSSSESSSEVAASSQIGDGDRKGGRDNLDPEIARGLAFVQALGGGIKTANYVSADPLPRSNGSRGTMLNMGSSRDDFTAGSRAGNNNNNSSSSSSSSQNQVIGRKRGHIETNG